MGVKNLFMGNTLIRALVEEIIVSGCLHFYKGPDERIHFSLLWHRVPKGLGGFMDELAEMGTSSLLEMAVQGHTCHEGLKAVTLNQLDAEALENTALNFPACEYNQPFPTLYVDLPPSFFQKHEVDCPQAGEVYAGRATPERHYPHTVGLRHYKNDEINYVIVSVYFTSQQAFTLLLDMTEASGTLEETIQVSRDPLRQLQNSKLISDEEDEVTLAAIRVALNTVLILESEGMRKLGPADAKYYNRLEENVRKARKRRDPDEKIQRAEQMLRVEPVYYTFDQHVVVYTHENGPEYDGPYEHTGRHLRPHWRSGYHRMQHFGIANTQRKRIRIPPVMVNKHKFVGRVQDTSVVYEIRK